jgi:hypothetical protein
MSELDRLGDHLQLLRISVDNASKISQFTILEGSRDLFAIPAPNSTNSDANKLVLEIQSFIIRNRTGDIAQVAVFNPSSADFPISFSLGPHQEYMARLPGSTYFVGVLTKDWLFYFKMAISDTPDIQHATHWYYVENNDLKFGTVPAAAVRHPVSGSGADDIQQEIGRIRDGRNAPMPPPQAARANLDGRTGMDIENGTSCTLSVFLSGAVSHKVQLAPGVSQTVTLPPGNYEVAATVSCPNVVPVYGKENLGSNTQYSEKFYIERR